MPEKKKMPFVVRICGEIATFALLIPTIAFKTLMAVHMRKQMIIAWNERVDNTKAFMNQLKKELKKCGGCPRAAKCKKRHKPKYVS